MALFVGTTPVRSPEEEAKRREHVQLLAALASSGLSSPAAPSAVLPGVGAAAGGGGDSSGGAASPDRSSGEEPTGSVRGAFNCRCPPPLQSTLVEQSWARLACCVRCALGTA